MPSAVFAEDEALTPIMGESSLTPEAMYQYLITHNKTDGLNPVDEDYAKAFVVTTIKEAKREGVRADVAFALMMHETGFLNFGGDVVPTQNNFGGLGTTGGGVKGASFENMQLGIRGVVQHLKCYASTEPLASECVDPRYSESLRGQAPYVQWLGKDDNPNGYGWAVPGTGYGNRLLGMIEEINAVDTSAVPAISLDDEEEPAEAETTALEKLKALFQNLSSGDIINFAIAFALFVIFLLIVKGLKPKKENRPGSKKRYTR